MSTHTYKIIMAISLKLILFLAMAISDSQAGTKALESHRDHSLVKEHQDKKTELNLAQLLLINDDNPGVMKWHRNLGKEAFIAMLRQERPQAPPLFSETAFDWASLEELFDIDPGLVAIVLNETNFTQENLSRSNNRRFLNEVLRLASSEDTALKAALVGYRNIQGYNVVQLEMLQNFPNLDLYERVLGVRQVAALLREPFPEDRDIFEKVRRSLTAHDAFYHKDGGYKEFCEKIWRAIVDTDEVLDMDAGSTPAFPLAIRALNVLGDRLVSSQAQENQEEVFSAAMNIISNGGLFGMNFARKANTQEARSIVDTIHASTEALWNHVNRSSSQSEDLEGFIFALKTRFFRPMAGLTLQKQKNLDSHQYNCTLFALHGWYQGHRKVFDDKTLFEAIDRHLADEGQKLGTTSKARYKKLAAYYGLDDRNEF